jgi:pimeloyl-ACP methyl ester carboxylesterase
MSRAFRRATIAALAMWVGACGPSPTPRPSAPAASATSAASVDVRPKFEAAPCPEDVSEEVVYEKSCGYLTTLEDRSKPEGRTVRLLVVRIDPPGGTSTPDPMIMVSDRTFGARPDYGGFGGRMHRVEYLIDPRGTAHSQPSLDCPEVEAVSPTLVGLGLTDPAHAAMLGGAVQACHDRLVGQGIDLAAYDVAAEAADIEDLRVALGIDRWNAIAYGIGSRIAFEEVRAFPGGLRTIIVDSPTLPAPDLLTVGPAALDLGISRLAAVCQATPACARQMPDLAAVIPEAVARLDQQPLILDVDGTDRAKLVGHPIRVVVDGEGLIRWIRATLTDEEGRAALRIIVTVLRVIEGRVGPNDDLVVRLAGDTGDCLGILPACTDVSVGATYSIVCRDLLPALDQARVDRDIGGRQPYIELFSPGPLGVICPAWSVPAAPTADIRIGGTVPTLILRGSIDPFSAPPADLTEAIGSATDVYDVEIPNVSYNVLSFACPRTIRDAWVDSPSATPADTSCLAQMPPLQLGE